jgi:hypothetical protein
MAQLPNFMTLPKIWLLTKSFFSFKGRVIFKQYIPKKRFSIKIFKLRDSDGYTGHESILWEEETVHGTACDSKPCDNYSSDKEEIRT